MKNLIFLLCLLSGFLVKGQVLSHNTYKPDTVNVEKMNYQGLPLTIKVKKLEATLGKPDSIQIFGKGNINTLEAIKQIDDPVLGVPPEAIYKYGDTLSYRVKGTIAQLAYIKLRNSNAVISHPQFEMSGYTRLSNMKKLFPQSYESKNMGTDAGLTAFINDIERVRYTYIHLIPEDKEKGTIVLLFYDDQLDSIVF